MTALDLLRRHRWPGNVRELENLIRRLAVLHSGDTIPAAAVSAELKEPARTFAADAGEGPQSLAASVEQYLTQYFLAQGDRLPPPGVYDRILQEVERPLISICLAATRGNQIRAAQLLGLNRNTLRKKIRDLGLGSHPRACGPNRRGAITPTAQGRATTATQAARCLGCRRCPQPEMPVLPGCPRIKCFAHSNAVMN